MTHIEDLVREALATTPSPSSTTDPLAALDRRVRRARRRLAAGAGVVAAVVAAAVVVPLVVVGGNDKPNGVGIVNPPSSTPTPTPSPVPLPSGTTALWTNGAVWATTTGNGQRWLLYQENGHNYVQPVDGNIDQLTSVQSPADYLVSSGDVLWVIGSGDGTSGGGSRVTAIDTRTRNSATLTWAQAQLSHAVADADALYVVQTDAGGDSVDRIDFNNQGMGITAQRSLPGAQEIVATAKHHVWVHAGSRLVEVTPTPGGFDFGARVDWGDGPMLAPTLPRTSPDDIWTDGGRLIALNPSALAGCVSCAEGYRVFVSGRPSAAIETQDGLFVAIPGSGLDFYSPQDFASGNTPVTASIDGIQVISLSADPTGGVDYVDDQGDLIHWQPQAR